ncbi:uncharacterized protein C2orf81 homolog [Pyxicephalus adspersus]|uniref:Uncharacterized protein n=1 Tax=Pyxicephalus adspersus TaxID=30357 RepID=A0AAV3APX9_PYXAD|nr:TPA: hypothetical protein GDO54_009776 [Pyxicephalus adspersus]
MSSNKSGAPVRPTATPGQGVSRVAASKSRTDKSRTVTVAPIPQVSVDIIPGRFTEDEWLSMVVTEDGEEVVGDIMDSLISRVMEECYKVYLQRQLIPYTISQAGDAMIRIIEWAFIPRDDGEDDNYPKQTWQEEPQPCPNDSWAQGCVPVTQPVPAAHPPQVSSQYPMTPIPEQEPQPQEEEIPKSPPEVRPPSPQQLNSPPTEETENQTSLTENSPPVIKPTPPPQPPKNKTRYRPYRGPLRSAGLKNITKSLEETEKELFLEELLNVKEDKELNDINFLPTSLHNILKIQLGRPPQKKDVIYDEAGNVLSVPKVDLAKLPQHHIRPRIEVLDPNKEAECRVRKTCPVNIQTSIQRQERERRIRDKGQPKLSTGPSAFDPQTYQASTLTNSTRAGHVRDPMATTAGLNLDTIQLTHGVILREGNTTQRGSIHSLKQRELAWREESRQLQPIRPSITLPSLSVEQLIKNNVPQVQPLVSFIST